MKDPKLSNPVGLTQIELTLMRHNLFGVDNCLELDAQVCLNGKKKLAGKRITGLQVTIVNSIVVCHFCLYFDVFVHL